MRRLPQKVYIALYLLREDITRSRDRGATAVEYGLLVALIAAVIIGAVLVLGGKISASFTKVNNSL